MIQNVIADASGLFFCNCQNSDPDWSKTYNAVTERSAEA